MTHGVNPSAMVMLSSEGLKFPMCDYSVMCTPLPTVYITVDRCDLYMTYADWDTQPLHPIYAPNTPHI